MKNLILSTAAAALLSTSAFATNISTDFFKANGYTKPTQSIVDIQTKIDNGTYTQYPFVSGISNTGLFEDKLKPGIALPQIKNVTNLLKALDKKQSVKVASIGGEVSVCLPIFAEIAKQNGAKCDDLMDHLVSGQADGEDFFSNIDSVLDSVRDKADEIMAELGDDISEEVTEEVTKEVPTEILEALGVEDLTAEVSDVVANLEANYNADFQRAIDDASEYLADFGSEATLEDFLDNVDSSVSLEDAEAAYNIATQ